MMRAISRTSNESLLPPKGTLRHESIISVRFCEVDSYQIVWHGNYINYLEVGREAFGKKYGISYQDLIDRGFRAPIIHVDVDYRRSLKYGDRFRVVTEYVEKPQAKICFRYTVTSLDGKTIYCRGNTEQVLQDFDSGRTLPSLPGWYEGWLAQAKTMA